MTKTRKKILLVIFILLLTIFVAFAVSQPNIRAKADEYTEEIQILSEMSAEECFDFIVEQGVAIPPEFSLSDELKMFVKNTIEQVEYFPTLPFAINYHVTLNFAEEIRRVVNEYYGVQPIERGNIQTYASYQL